MPRTARIAPGGIVYHVFNRGVGGSKLFRSRRDYELFQQCLVQTLEAAPMRVLAYCVMPDHWQLVLWPREDGELAKFMLRLTVTHGRRWLIQRDAVGAGHVYQGRYKSFPIQNGSPVSTVCRYVERNPLRAKVAKKSGDWPWSSGGQTQLDKTMQVELARLPGLEGKDGRKWVDQPQSPAEEAALERCVRESRPFGDEKWLNKIKKTLGWREPLKHGRPRKSKA